MKYLTPVLWILLLGISPVARADEPRSAPQEAQTTEHEQDKASSFRVPISTAFVIPSVIVLDSVEGKIYKSRFLSTPHTRKVAATADKSVGQMNHGTGDIEAHTSVVFQYFPAENRVNLPPHTAHVTTWWGWQVCRVYETGGCDCGTNPNFNICTYQPMWPWREMLEDNARVARARAIAFLTAEGIRVSEEFDEIDLFFSSKAQDVGAGEAEQEEANSGGGASPN